MVNCGIMFLLKHFIDSILKFGIIRFNLEDQTWIFSESYKHLQVCIIFTNGVIKRGYFGNVCQNLNPYSSQSQELEISHDNLLQIKFGHIIFKANIYCLGGTKLVPDDIFARLQIQWIYWIIVFTVREENAIRKFDMSFPDINVSLRARTEKTTGKIPL